MNNQSYQLDVFAPGSSGSESDSNPNDGNESDPSQSGSITRNTSIMTAGDYINANLQGHTNRPRLSLWGSIKRPLIRLWGHIKRALIRLWSRVKYKLLLSTLFTAIALTAISFCFGYKSRYINLFSPSSLLPHHSFMGVLIMQIMTSLSVFVVRQFFILSCDTLRWHIAATTNGINFLDFMILSPAYRLTTMLDLLRVILLSDRRYPKKTIALIISRIFVLYIVLFAAPFIWLFQLEPTIAFRLDGRNTTLQATPGFGLGIGHFRFIQRHPFPYSRLDSWGYLSDTTSVLEVGSTKFCNLTSDYKNCAAFALTGYSDLSVVASDLKDADDRRVFVLYDIPIYIVEFWSRDLPANLDEFTDPGVYCRNISTEAYSFLQICLKGESSLNNGTDYHFKAGFQFCLDSRNCTPIMKTVDGNEAYNNTIFVTDMAINKANSTLVLDLNGTILDIASVSGRVNTPVNISEFFTAFTSPLDYVLVNNTLFLETDYLPSQSAVDNFYQIFSDYPNLNSSRMIMEDYVNSLAYAFTSPLPSQAPRDHLRGWLAYALASNSGVYYGSLTRDSASQTYVLKISPWSLGLYLGINLAVVVACLLLLSKYWRQFGVVPSFGPLSESAMLYSAMQEVAESDIDFRRVFDRFPGINLQETVELVKYYRIEWESHGSKLTIRRPTDMMD